jgi:hypothetical protein
MLIKNADKKRLMIIFNALKNGLTKRQIAESLRIKKEDVNKILYQPSP